MFYILGLGCSEKYWQVQYAVRAIVSSFVYNGAGGAQAPPNCGTPNLAVLDTVVSRLSEKK